MSVEKVKLLPCVWCGDATQLKPTREFGYMTIKCNTCTSEGPAITLAEDASRHAESIALLEAQRKWNSRVPEEVAN